MIKSEELLAMKAIAICFKPFLKPEEALIYCNLGRTQFAKKCEESRVYKNVNGYYMREDIDRMLAGETRASSSVEMHPRNRRLSKGNYKG